jgi:hypothetical protein
VISLQLLPRCQAVLFVSCLGGMGVHTAVYGVVWGDMVQLQYNLYFYIYIYINYITR